MELNNKSVTKETWHIGECAQTKEHVPRESNKEKLNQKVFLTLMKNKTQYLQINRTQLKQ